MVTITGRHQIQLGFMLNSVVDGYGDRLRRGGLVAALARHVPRRPWPNRGTITQMRGGACQNGALFTFLCIYLMQAEKTDCCKVAGRCVALR
jgi:hypothetical protein